MLSGFSSPERKRRPSGRLVAFVVGSLVAFGAASAHAADASHPAVVELFQSQGCSSCPPANANVNALSQRADVLALSFAVTYWDRLGWKDTFAKPQFTERQWQYARAMRQQDVYTPQVVVNGRVEGVGAVASTNVALADDVAAKPDAMSTDHMSSDHMGTTKKPTTTKHAMEEHMAKPDTMSSDHMAPEAPKQ